MEFSYSKLANNPLRKSSHASRADEEARKSDFALAQARGVKPRWSEDRFIHCDKVALHHGKRCILWDDEGSGFYMWLNWDWGSNCPEQMGADDERKDEPGWYHNVSKFFASPLLDTTVPEPELAAWIDANTMCCHQKLLERLTTVRKNTCGVTGARWVLDDPYQGELDSSVFNDTA